MARPRAVQAGRPLAYRARIVGNSGRQDLAARTPAGVWLHAGGSLPLPRTDGGEWRGSGRVDGHRHADRGAERAPPPALRLFQAELRPGHQSTDRSDPRGIGDEPDVHDRPAPQSSRARGGVAQAPRNRTADPDQRGSGQDPLGRSRAGRCIPHGDHRHDLGRQHRGRWPRHGDQGNVLGRDRSGVAGSHDPHPVGPRTGAGPDPDACPAGDLCRAPPAGAPGPAHADRPGGRNRRSARSASFLRLGGLRRGSDQSLCRLRNA